jgi:hypothetical protein
MVETIRNAGEDENTEFTLLINLFYIDRPSKGEKRAAEYQTAR